MLFSVVTGVLDSAIDDKLIRDNPCKAKTVRRPTSPAIDVKDIWSENRVGAIQAGIESRWKITIPLGAGLGLRQGEILGCSPMTSTKTRWFYTYAGSSAPWSERWCLPCQKGNKTRTVPLSPGVLAEIRITRPLIHPSRSPCRGGSPPVIL